MLSHFTTSHEPLKTHLANDASISCFYFLWQCHVNSRAPLDVLLESFYVVRVGRIELPSRPWQGRVLPLNHARLRSAEADLRRARPAKNPLKQLR